MHKCRSCEKTNLNQVLSFGKLPLANNLLKKQNLQDREYYHTLTLLFCNNCALLQISETVDPHILFSHYHYCSSFSDTMLTEMRKLADQIAMQEQLTQQDLVIEIGSNDGYLLQHYQAKGIPVLGIEPAENIAKIAVRKGIPTHAQFFTIEYAKQLKQQGIHAKIIHIHNVLAHVADLNGFISGLSIVLQETGKIIIEVPYVRDLIEQCAFDTIYHEHLCYFSLYALNRLFNRHHLYINDVERLKIHGGSLRLFITHYPHTSTYLDTLIQTESEIGMHQFPYYANFQTQILTLKEKLLSLLMQLKKMNYKIAAYGASAKGTTLLNYFSIGKNYLDFIVDRSPLKQGMYSPGMHLPILAPEALIRKHIDYTLLLSWNFSDEIIKQQQDYLSQGGKFIHPINLSVMAAHKITEAIDINTISH